jgi:hypothetical protein
MNFKPNDRDPMAGHYLSEIRLSALHISTALRQRGLKGIPKEGYGLGISPS